MSNEYTSFSPYSMGYETSASVGLYPQRELTGLDYDIASGCSVWPKVNRDGVGRIVSMNSGTNKLQVDWEYMDLGGLAEKLWNKMYEKKPIVYCAHCESGNVFDNPNCVSCGAPMGRSLR